jgi:hypothetical protein
MVVICLPTASLTGIAQERTGDAVDMHRAGAALRDAAAVFGAGQADVLADRPEQGRAVVDVDVVVLAVDVETGHSRPPFQEAFPPPFTSNRKWNSP